MGAIGDPYLTLEKLKSYLSMGDDSRFDDDLEDAIKSITEEINGHCNRQFNRAETATARLFVAASPTWTPVADFWDPATVVIETGPGYSVTWSATDYELDPLDGVVDDMPGWPRWNLLVPQAGSKLFTRGQRIRVTAKWGWETVPDAVVQAAKIMAGATFQIKDAPFGVAGSDQWGTIRVKDNQMAEKKLSRFIKDRILTG